MIGNTFATFDIDMFLREHWQKKPLLIRNPWTAWTNPVHPDDLAGLSCRDDVESRLIVQKSKNWAVQHGPIAEKRFSKLGKHPWTLLVQAVDMHVPAVSALLDPFRFIPNWRIDDVMVSYASDGGGVGPHFDQYDVFLVQGFGTRRWQVGGLCDADTPLMPHDELRLLAAFEPTDEWLLEPGDMLYLPPRYAHNGAAVGDDCMTYSVGFRAPSRGELIAQWSDDLIASLSDDDRYVDPVLLAAANPGEIAPAALDRLHAMVLEKLQDRMAFANWFGRYSTAPKYADLDYGPDAAITVDALREKHVAGKKLSRSPASRFSYVQDRSRATLFVDGDTFGCKAAIAQEICGADPISITKSNAALLVTLINQGSLIFDS